MKRKRRQSQTLADKEDKKESLVYCLSNIHVTVLIAFILKSEKAEERLKTNNRDLSLVVTRHLSLVSPVNNSLVFIRPGEDEINGCHKFYIYGPYGDVQHFVSV